MSKVTIKFWDKKRKKYFSDDTALVFGLTAGVNLDVFSGRAPVNELEAHIYKDGERIDE